MDYRPALSALGQSCRLMVQIPPPLEPFGFFGNQTVFLRATAMEMSFGAIFIRLTTCRIRYTLHLIEVGLADGKNTTDRTAGTSPQAAGLAACRDQDASVHRRRSTGSGDAPASAATRRATGDALSGAVTGRWSPLRCVAGSRCGTQLANHVSDRHGCRADSGSLFQEDSEDSRRGLRAVPAAAQTVRRGGKSDEEANREVRPD